MSLSLVDFGKFPSQVVTYDQGAAKMCDKFTIIITLCLKPSILVSKLVVLQLTLKNVFLLFPWQSMSFNPEGNTDERFYVFTNSNCIERQSLLRLDPLRISLDAQDLV